MNMEMFSTDVSAPYRIFAVKVEWECLFNEIR